MKLEVQGQAAYAYTGGKPFAADGPEGGEPVVVFIHGALNDHSVWTLPARWFAHHGWRVLAVDLPAHGRSGGAPLASVEAMASWLLALLDAAGVAPPRKAALVGHSMGSLVALEAAGQAPERVGRLVMVGTTYPMPVSEMLLQTSNTDPQKAMDWVTGWSSAPFGVAPAAPGPGTWMPGAGRSLMRRLQAARPDVNLFHTDFVACDAYRGGEAAMAKLACERTVILGRTDQMTHPRGGRTLAKALDARLVELDSGHGLVGEASEAMLGALRAALGA